MNKSIILGLFLGLFLASGCEDMKRELAESNKREEEYKKSLLKFNQGDEVVIKVDGKNVRKIEEYSGEAFGGCFPNWKEIVLPKTGLPDDFPVMAEPEPAKEIEKRGCKHEHDFDFCPKCGKPKVIKQKIQAVGKKTVVEEYEWALYDYLGDLFYKYKKNVEKNKDACIEIRIDC